MFKIMMVDDEPLALAGMCNVIDWSRYGFTICAACNWPEDALEQARQLHPDVIITDLRMPDVDGMTLYRTLCKDGLQPELVIVSAYSDFDVARTAIEYGAAGYLLKPLQEQEVERLACRLAKKLNRRVLQPENEMPLSADRPEALAERLRELHLPLVYRMISGWHGDQSRLPADSVLVPIQSEELPELMLYAAPTHALPDVIDAAGCIVTPPAEAESDVTVLIDQVRAAVEGGFLYCSNPQAAQVQYFIGVHYAEPLSLDYLSRQFYLSGTYMSNFFKRNTGTNLVSFINQVRIQQACRLLVKSNMRLKEVSIMVGFHDYGHFNRQFRQMLGTSPEKYVAEHKI